MNHQLTGIPAPALAGVVRERTKAAAIAEINNCLYDGADMIDLHISCLEDNSPEALREIMNASRLPVLALHYNISADQGLTNIGEEERVRQLLAAVDAGAAGIDMQGYTFHAPSKSSFCGNNAYSFTNGHPKEVVTDPEIIVRQCDLIRQVHDKGAQVLLSCHPGIAMNCTQVVDLALFLEQRCPDIIKIVTRADSDDDLAECFTTMLTLKREVKTPVSFHASGRAGMLSRIINPALGGQIVFCVDRYSPASTMEQLDLRTARSIIDNLRKIGRI